MTVNIGIESQNLQEVCAILNKLLADEFVLYTKLRKYHWNTQSQWGFKEVHEFLEEQYESIAEQKDEIAERVRYLGGQAIGTLQEFSSLTSLKEDPGVYSDNKTMLTNILNDHETIIRDVRSKLDMVAEQYGDLGTQDFLIGVMQNHEKWAWMNRSYLINN